MRRFRSSVKANTMPEGNLGGAIHYHNEPATLKISPSFIFGLPVLMALVWFGGVFLLKQADFANPEEAWATILIATPVLAFLLYSWNKFQAGNKRRKQEHEKEMKRLELETLRLQRSLQPAFLNGSKVDNDIRLAELVMIIMQRVIVGEKRSGTAAWVLSKPVTRTAFVVSRIVVNAIAILLTSVVVPGLIVYVTLGTMSDIGWLSPLGFMGALVMVSLHAFFWIALVLMMGTLSERSGGVIAVPMVLYFFLWMGSGIIPGLVYVSPLLLTFSPDPDLMDSLAMSFMTGEPVASWLPLISTVVSCAVFVFVAIRRFNRQEF